MSTFAMRRWARFVALAGALGAGPVLAQTVTLDCSGDGSGCPARIADGTGVAAVGTVTVPTGTCDGASAITVAVRVQVRHANVGDLRLVLEEPLGDQYILLARARESTGAALGSCVGDDLNATFRDGGSAAVVCGELIPSIAGTLAPNTGLAALAGAVQTGDWELQVQDLASGGDGELVDWSLQFACDGDPTLFGDGFED